MDTDLLKPLVMTFQSLSDEEDLDGGDSDHISPPHKNPFIEPDGDSPKKEGTEGEEDDLEDPYGDSNVDEEDDLNEDTGDTDFDS